MDRSKWDSNRAGEQGAVAVVVALLLVVFVGVSALAIDLGAAWAEKRSLVADLDAAALAGARSAALSDCDVATAEDEAVLVAGINGTTISSADVIVDCDARTVEVQGARAPINVFGAAAGGEIEQVAGSATADFEVTPGNIMPLAMCINDQAIKDIRDYGPLAPAPTGSGPASDYTDKRGDAGYPVARGTDAAFGYYSSPVENVVHRVAADKVWTDGALCPSQSPPTGSGNWGWLTFGDGQGFNDLKEKIDEGYEGPVQVPGNDGDDGVCGESVDPAFCDAETGNMGQPAMAALRDRRCSDSSSACEPVGFVVFDQLQADKKGRATGFRLQAVLIAIIRDADRSGLNVAGATGKGSNFTTTNWVDVEPLAYIDADSALSLDDFGFGEIITKLCDNEQFDAGGLCGN